MNAPWGMLFAGSHSCDYTCMLLAQWPNCSELQPGLLSTSMGHLVRYLFRPVPCTPCCPQRICLSVCHCKWQALQVLTQVFAVRNYGCKYRATQRAIIQGRDLLEMHGAVLLQCACLPGAGLHLPFTVHLNRSGLQAGCHIWKSVELL